MYMPHRGVNIECIYVCVFGCVCWAAASAGLGRHQSSQRRHAVACGDAAASSTSSPSRAAPAAAAATSSSQTSSSCSSWRCLSHWDDAASSGSACAASAWRSSAGSKPPPSLPAAAVTSGAKRRTDEGVGGEGRGGAVQQIKYEPLGCRSVLYATCSTLCVCVALLRQVSVDKPPPPPLARNVRQLTGSGGAAHARAAQPPRVCRALALNEPLQRQGPPPAGESGFGPICPVSQGLRPHAL